MNKNYYAVLMAGGVGSRFWPVSTKNFPKQFHDILGTGETLIQKTFSRLAKIVPKENIYILTNEKYNDLVLEQLPEIQQQQVLLEPAMRNTAPCILYAALKIQKKNPEGIMIVAPSDHWIEDENSFGHNVQVGFDFCQKNDALMTLGIQPTFPNTGYGYIEYDERTYETYQGTYISAVHKFKEKPDYETAKYYLEQGNYLWNAGIFIWSVSSITKAFEVQQPEMTSLLKSGWSVYNTEFEDDFINDNYAKADNISIDYAILEKSDKVFVLPATFDWNDLGTWSSLYDKLDKDRHKNVVLNAKSLAEEAEGNIIISEKDKLVVIDGLQDYIIVDRNNVLLIYPKKKEQSIKLIQERLKSKYGD